MPAPLFQFTDAVPQTWDRGLEYLLQQRVVGMPTAQRVYIYYRVLCTPAILPHLQHPSTKRQTKLRSLAKAKLFEFYLTGWCLEARELHKYMFGCDFEPTIDITLSNSTKVPSRINWRGRAALKSVLDQAFPDRASAPTIN
jgi:hypothetical protein